jgi:hypothetical protein
MNSSLFPAKALSRAQKARANRKTCPWEDKGRPEGRMHGKKG